MILVRDLKVTFESAAGRVAAVNGVSFGFGSGVAFGLVGPSGSGKSTVLRAIAGLLTDWEGQIAVSGDSVEKRRDKSFYRNVQMVFQEPATALHPRKTVNELLREPLAIHGLKPYERRIAAALEDVELDPAMCHRYPHQLSGGQRQRVALARALVLEPSVLLLDEPTSALDVSVQASILKLLARIRRDRRMTYLLVSHNIAVVAELCSWFAVMEKGRIAEIQRTDVLAADRQRSPLVESLVQAAAGYRRPTKLADKIRSDFAGSKAESRLSPESASSGARPSLARVRPSLVPGQRIIEHPSLGTRFVSLSGRPDQD